MIWNPEGRALQGRVAELLAALPVQPGKAARIERSAATIVMRFQQAERRGRQSSELDTAEDHLAELNGQLVKLKDFIKKMPEEVCWLLDCNLRDFDAVDSDNYVPAPVGEDGWEQLTRLAQCLVEISAMEEVTSAWAAEARQHGRSGHPGAAVKTAVADAALFSLERLTGATVGKNPEGKEIDFKALDLVTQLFKIFDLKGRPGAPRYHLFRAIDRRKALAA